MKKTVISAASALIGAVIGTGVVGKVMSQETKNARFLADKHLALFLMMDQWVKVKQEGKRLDTYFERNHYRKIAVYGMSYVGQTLVDELKNTDIVVAYGIDKKADNLYADIDIVSGEDTLENVDVVVVTAITFFEEIAEKLATKLDCPIVSLEDILYEV